MDDDASPAAAVHCGAEADNGAAANSAAVHRGARADSGAAANGGAASSEADTPAGATQTDDDPNASFRRVRVGPLPPCDGDDNVPARPFSGVCWTPLGPVEKGDSEPDI
jgi:hypothetical protein